MYIRMYVATIKINKNSTSLYKSHLVLHCSYFIVHCGHCLQCQRVGSRMLSDVSHNSTAGSICRATFSMHIIHPAASD